jgi:predicted 3-demethylubiquinone-9 3-methyltransferase (glyoxalase superfamily)
MKNSKITPCLWFDPASSSAEEAVDFYASVFENFEKKRETRYSKESSEATGIPKGTIMTIEFEIEGQDFIILNGGPHFKINPSISFFVNCETEAEVDKLWEKLSEGGKALMPLDKYDYSDKYGWIEDKYGVSWQIILSKPEGDWRPKIIPCFLFTNEKSGKTKEAIDFYVSVFDDSKIGMIAPNDKPGAEETTAFADFMIEGQWFAAMDSPYEHEFGFNEGVSFYVNCKDQKEIDYFWDKLTSGGGEESVCGWLKDKFGISWQIAPENIDELIAPPKAMQAMMKMKKLDIETLKNAGL